MHNGGVGMLTVRLGTSRDPELETEPLHIGKWVREGTIIFRKLEDGTHLAHS
jgi:hypothetical protein